MRDLEIYFNKKTYYITVTLVITVMFSGVVAYNPLVDEKAVHPLSEYGIGFQLHKIFFVLFSASLLIYPKYPTHLHRIILISFAFIFCYLLFFLYPNTWSTFIFLCFIPAISILFFDKKLFYFSLILNSMLIIFTFSYILLIDQGNFYPYIKLDLFGNFINFLTSQVIIYFIYYLTQNRIEKMQLYYEEIKQAERLKMAGQLAAAVAHEIRNPLTVVKGFLQLYEREASIEGQKTTNYPLLIDELEAAEQVISQFLALSKPSKNPTVELVEVKESLQSVSELLYSYGLQRGIKIDLTAEANHLIRINRIEFKQLLVNLIKNAIEASKNDDIILVSLSRVRDSIEIKIIDEGLGMTKEEIESLGTPFYSLKSKGTGLGMMICFNIVAKYKGKISFQSSKGQGTTVTISFPAVKS